MSMQSTFEGRFGQTPSLSTLNRYITYKTLHQLSFRLDELPFSLGFSMEQVYKHVDRLPSLALSKGLYIFYERARRSLRKSGPGYYGPEVEWPITTESFLSSVFAFSRFRPDSLICEHRGCRNKSLYAYFCDDCIRYEWPEVDFAGSEDYFLAWKSVDVHDVVSRSFKGQQGCIYPLCHVSIPHGISNFTPSPLGAMSYSDWRSWLIGAVILTSETVMNDEFVFDNCGPVLPIAAFSAQDVLNAYTLSQGDVREMLKDVNRHSPRVDGIEQQMASAAVEQMLSSLDWQQVFDLLPTDFWRPRLNKLLPYAKNNLPSQSVPPQDFPFPL